jgi:hypothetical protein
VAKGLDAENGADGDFFACHEVRREKRRKIECRSALWGREIGVEIGGWRWEIGRESWKER